MKNWAKQGKDVGKRKNIRFINFNSAHLRKSLKGFHG